MGIDPVHPTPDSGRIAYLSVTDDYWQVWEMAANGDRQRQVTFSPGDKLRISWFPDGSSLLVVSHMGRVFRANIETGEEQSLKLSAAGILDGTLSPDGKQIAYSLSDPATRDENDIWLADASGSRAKKFVALESLQHQPVFSPDGEFIYFLSGDGKEHHDIWRKSLDGRRLEQITVGQHFHFGISVAPDGSLAFSNNRTDDYEIWIRATNGVETRLTRSAGLDGHPSWSPDSTSLTFHSNRSGVLSIWRVNRDGSELVQLTKSPSNAREPQWWVPVSATLAESDR